MRYSISGGTIVTPDLVIQGGTLVIEDNMIAKMSSGDDGDADLKIKLSPSDLIFPGLINSHDHLLGNYYPRVGTGPYLNWRPWDNDLKSAEVYQERGHISNFDLYLFAAYRNIISGVTTVSDHIPHPVNEKFINQLPLRVPTEYTLAHEMSSYDLKWGAAPSVEHREAVQNDWPFITHLEEGYDAEAMLGIEIMEELKVLDEHTVLIHGISLSDEDIDKVAKAKSSLVWCPSSNYFMFEDTVNIKRLLENKVNVALGTDSPMSGGLNIFEEMQFARSLYKELYNEEIDSKTLVQMVTVNAAKALRLKKLGKIEAGYLADLTIIQNGDIINPYESLVNSWFHDIRMVIKDGVPIYGLPQDYDFMNNFEEHYQLLEIDGQEKILIGNPVDLYERMWEDVKFKKTLPFFPITM